MKTHKECKIELVASSDASRYAISEPYLDGDTLVSTNGIALVALKVERGEGDKDGYVTADVLKAARRLTTKSLPEVSIVANGNYTLADGSVLPRKHEGNFPNWRQVMPRTEGESKPRHVIGLNAKLLWEMAQAMGAEELRLEILDGTSAVIVKPAYAKKTCAAPEGTIGALMPVKLAEPIAETTKPIVSKF